MNATEHPIAQDELMAYLDGELSPDRAAVAVAHLEHCSDCQLLANEFRDVSGRLTAWEVAPPDSSIPTAILAALEEKEPQTESAKINWPTLRGNVFVRRWTWAGAFAILCIVVGLVIKIAAPKQYAVQIRKKTLDQHAVSAERKTRSLSQPVATATPGIAADSNGFFHGLGDHGENSFSVDGQPSADQQGKAFDKLQQFAKLQNPPPTTFAPASPMIIRTAGIMLSTDDFDKARTALDEILKRHHGYVGELNVSTPTGSGRSFTATLRIPADQIDATIADLQKLGRVESESQNGEEVTAQYVDLEARLTNARHTEERLTDLLHERTGKLSDVLAFEKEIDRVRGEIERMEAERKNLASQVELATINANVMENYKAQLQLAPVSTFGQIHNAAVEGYRTMVDGVAAVVMFVFSWGPSLLFWGGILFFPLRAVWRKIRRSPARS
jgi:hypothetical protein